MDEKAVVEEARTSMASWRRMGSLLVGAILVLASALVASVAAAAPARSHQGLRRASERGVLKIGLLVDQTGVDAVLGADQIDGWNLYWKQHGDTVDGWKIQSLFFDTNSSPSQAITEARRAVASGVYMEVGPFLANEMEATAAYFLAQKIPVSYGTTPADLAPKVTGPYFVGTLGWTFSQPSMVAAEWACKVAHYKTAVTIADNYQFGWSSMGGFAQVYSDLGCHILKQLWNPLGTVNYSPYFSAIAAAHPSMVFAEEVSADAGHFLEQWSSFGLKGKIPLIAHDDLVNQADIHGVPAKDVLGIISFRHYTSARNDPINREFDLAYAKAYGELPAYVAAEYYTTAQWIASAIKMLHGNLSNKAEFVRAMRAVRLSDSLFGPLGFDKYGDVLQGTFMAKAEPTPAEFRKWSPVWNVVLKYYPPTPTAAFGPCNPKEFLAQPPYSPAFQGIDDKATTCS